MLSSATSLGVGVVIGGALESSAGRDAVSGDVEFRLFVNLCEIAPETLDAMTVADYLRLQKACEDFTSPPLTSDAPGPS